ncbi:homoserine dehydrogenase [Daejeonella oryzae]|uniref:homoserine dehydrogenase n=1 Tax=Daejeonella oryzae TaxID=1122943 RepID=UPI00040FBE72|nr:homoserine dehydrogenase [Daejeonella oryzae]
MDKKLTIGLVGFGVVGQGLYDIISSKDLNIDLKKIVIKDASKKRSLPSDYFTTNIDEVLLNPDINTIVELINDADTAFVIVSRALKSGKNVVSANKKMIAEHLKELVEIQQQHGTSLLYEGAVCGSIPIIRNLEEYYDNELLYSISGIFNGSSNYILSKIFNEGLDYDTALKQAQDLGFAETDATLDVGGFDPKFKLVIAAAHAYGTFINPAEVLNIGIQSLSPHDLQYAREKNYKIKLIASARKNSDETSVLLVLPKMIRSDNFLYNVENEYNGVIVQAAFADQQFFFGKGAGGHPTGAAVLSDIAALRYQYRYEYKKYHQKNRVNHSNDLILNVYLRYTDESLLNNLEFETISERFYSANFQFIIGKISLENLIRNVEFIRENGAFIAEIPEDESHVLIEEQIQELIHTH